MNTNWITVALIVIGLLIALGGGLRDAYRDFRNKRHAGWATNAQIVESARVASEADVCFSLHPVSDPMAFRLVKNGIALHVTDAIRIVQAPPYNWQDDE